MGGYFYTQKVFQRFLFKKSLSMSESSKMKIKFKKEALTNNIYRDIYYIGGVTMEVAKIFENGRSQAVRLPKKFRFSGEEVFVQKLGGAVLLVPKEAAWQTFLNSLNSFTDDFFENGRMAEVPTERDFWS